LESSPANKGNSTSSVPVCVSFIYFFCFISLAKNSSTTLNNNDNSERLISLLILEEMISGFAYSAHYELNVDWI
jgi:hypothetical protein